MLRGISTADRLYLSSGGTISDDGTADVTVTNNASFLGDAITLDDTYAFGSLTFNSPGAVEITETDATILRGTSTADRLSLTSDGTISDDGTADVTVTNNASFHGDAITLDDTYAFGSLTFNSPGAVEITETDATILRGTSTADRLYLTSDGTISDDGTADVTVTNNASFLGDAITLDDTYAFGSLTFNSPGAVEITETDATILRGTSTADRLSLTSDGTISDDGTADVTVTNNASFLGDAITLDDTYAFGSLTFNSPGAVEITETDATVLRGTSTADRLSLTSGGTISDDGTADVTVTNNASFRGDAITLDDTYAFGSLTFNSPGAVEITETDATILRGTSTADSLSLTSDGTITDDGTADVTVTNNASFHGDAITLDRHVRLRQPDF